MAAKYKLTSETIEHNGKTLYRIQALKNFSNVKTGDVGGYIESEKNLSHRGNCWIYDEAQVSGEAQVYDEARVSGEALVYDQAQVFGEACVYDEAQVSGEALVYDQAQVFDEAWVYDKAWVFAKACVLDEAQVSGKAWVYGEALVSGKAQVFGNIYITDKFIRVWFDGKSLYIHKNYYVFDDKQYTSDKNFDMIRKYLQNKIG